MKLVKYKIGDTVWVVNKDILEADLPYIRAELKDVNTDSSQYLIDCNGNMILVNVSQIFKTEPEALNASKILIKDQIRRIKLQTVFDIIKLERLIEPNV